MKAILSLATALLLLGTLAATAQQYTVVNTSCTNTITKNATELLSLGSAIPLTKYDSVSLQITGIGDQAGTGLCTFRFAPSADGTTYTTDNNAMYNVGVSLNGRTAVCITTNLTVNSIGYLKLVAVVNADANAAMTNCVVKYAVKPRRNG